MVSWSLRVWLDIKGIQNFSKWLQYSFSFNFSREKKKKNAAIIISKNIEKTVVPVEKKKKLHSFFLKFFFLIFFLILKGRNAFAFETLSLFSFSFLIRIGQWVWPLENHLFIFFFIYFFFTTPPLKKTVNVVASWK